MPEIPKEYPTELSDEELLKLIRECTIQATVVGRSSSYAANPQYWKEMAELGQNEVSNRTQKNLLIEIGNLKEEITLLKRDNKISGRINSILSFLTIILAFITIYIGYQSLNITKSGKVDGESKQTTEMRILQENNTTLQAIYEEIKQFEKEHKEEDSLKLLKK
ncbi:MAG: hypothetical protein HOO91_12540 [Bacteroidales bacterium]|nr:hypothetical protein [Bacteroidales bacterium]